MSRNPELREPRGQKGLWLLALLIVGPLSLFLLSLWLVLCPHAGALEPGEHLGDQATKTSIVYKLPMLKINLCHFLILSD